MGYRSQIVFKTTTEGYILCRKFNDMIPKEEERPLYDLKIAKTESGFYKFSQSYIKWYDSYPSVHNFSRMLGMLQEYDIPYKFIRIGEDYNDIEISAHYPEDSMPDEISDLSVETEVCDPDDYKYESIK